MLDETGKLIELKCKECGHTVHVKQTRYAHKPICHGKVMEIQEAKENG